MNPMYLMLSATLASSLAFMLPVSTPPNALVFSYGDLKTTDMVSFDGNGQLTTLFYIINLGRGIPGFSSVTNIRFPLSQTYQISFTILTVLIVTEQ